MHLSEIGMETESPISITHEKVEEMQSRLITVHYSVPIAML